MIHLLQICNHVWKWFDMTTLKWCPYSASNNKTIDDAYWAGESSVMIINGRRKYTIQFNIMVQVRNLSFLLGMTPARRGSDMTFSKKVLMPKSSINEVI